MGGGILDGPSRRLRHTARRVWRLHLALQAAVKRRRIAGRALEVLVGHVVHAFELLRTALSILKEVYKFVGEHRHSVGGITAPVCRELEVASWLVFLTEVDLGPWA